MTTISAEAMTDSAGPAARARRAYLREEPAATEQRRRREAGGGEIGERHRQMQPR